MTGPPNTSYPPLPSAPTNGWAIASLVAALLALSLVAVICGHIALVQIPRNGQQGKSLAIIGLVLGYLEMLAIVVGLAITAGLIVWGAAQ
ncbi:MAG: DUF4190 domain-containing protein [Beutenbergiaceae bacterium]